MHYIYIFGSSCPLTEFCQVQNSLYVQVLHSPILEAVLHGTPAAGDSQTLRHGTRNGIMELSQTAPSMAGRPSRWSSVHILVLVKVACSSSCHVEKCDDLERNLKMSLNIIDIFMSNRNRHISEMDP